MQPAADNDVEGLRNNPWAVALASPVRMCQSTKTRLPEAFLGRWGLIQRPDSEGLWFAPTGLLGNFAAPAGTNMHSMSSHMPTDNTDMTAEEVSKAETPIQRTEAAGADDTTPVSSLPPEINKGKDLTLYSNSNSPRPLTLRIVDRFPVIGELTRRFSDARSKKKSPMRQILPIRWVYPHGPIGEEEGAAIIWRADMPAFLLRCMRKDILERLKRACDSIRSSNMTRKVWTEIPISAPLTIAGGSAGLDYSQAAIEEALKQIEPFERMENGVILVLNRYTKVEEEQNNSDVAQKDGNSQSEETVGEDGAGRQPKYEHANFSIDEMGLTPEIRDMNSSIFPDFVRLPHSHRKVPVIDASVLLSRAELDELRSHDSRFKSAMLFFRPDDLVTVEAVLSLWKLKGSIMHDQIPSET